MAITNTVSILPYFQSLCLCVCVVEGVREIILAYIIWNVRNCGIRYCLRCSVGGGGEGDYSS